MAGIYVHIPFCRKACHYCNFHFSTSLKSKDALIDAILKEFDLRKNYLKTKIIKSIYFGGGTPSLLSEVDLQLIFAKLNDLFEWDKNVEITLEANPDDLTVDYCRVLKEIGVNRLSIGIQSFKANDLTFMNRSHDDYQGVAAIENTLNAGFVNFSIDLMFGLIGSNLSDWNENLNKLLEYQPPHISCYNLTIEEQTAFHKWEKISRIKTPEEAVQFDQFIMAHNLLTAAGYDHYEISNYCSPGKEAIHNRSYWDREPYLGIGPSAHSYNGAERHWNVANNAKYIKMLQNDEILINSETLSERDRYNERLMLGLRTSQGVKKEDIDEFDSIIKEHFYNSIEPLLQNDIILFDNGSYRLEVEKWYASDSISSQLFFVD